MAMWWPALVNKMKLISLSCAQEALFSVRIPTFLFPIFLIIFSSSQSSSQILGLSSLQIKSQTEGLGPEC